MTNSKGEIPFFPPEKTIPFSSPRFFEAEMVKIEVEKMVGFPGGKNGISHSKDLRLRVRLNVL